MTPDGTPTVEDVAASKRLTDEILDLLAANGVSTYVAAVAILNALGTAIVIAAKEAGMDPMQESRLWAHHLCSLVELNSAAGAQCAGERRH
jgi:hypothetical protein